MLLRVRVGREARVGEVVGVGELVEQVQEIFPGGVEPQLGEGDWEDMSWNWFLKSFMSLPRLCRQ